MFCKQCGQKLRDNAVFCSRCGARQQKAEQEQTQQDVGELDKTVGIFDAAPSQPTPQPTAGWTAGQPQAQPGQGQPGQGQPFPRGEGNHGAVGFGKAVALFFQNYGNFHGRASRSEYWWAFFFNAVVMLIPVPLLTVLFPPLGIICSLALIVPGISVCVRRLHDAGVAGTWWFICLVPLVGLIVMLVLLLRNSDGDNRWGPGAGTAAPTVYTTGAQQYNPGQRGVSEDEIYVMAQNHAPLELSTPDAQRMMNLALGKITPFDPYTQNFADALMQCTPQSLHSSIAAMDTDSLLIAFKALGYRIGQGESANVLGMAQQTVLETLKNRF